MRQSRFLEEMIVRLLRELEASEFTVSVFMKRHGSPARASIAGGGSTAASRRVRSNEIISCRSQRVLSGRGKRNPESRRPCEGKPTRHDGC
jgi:hypothetical protein